MNHDLTRKPDDIVRMNHVETITDDGLNAYAEAHEQMLAPRAELSATAWMAEALPMRLAATWVTFYGATSDDVRQRATYSCGHDCELRVTPLYALAPPAPAEAAPIEALANAIVDAVAEVRDPDFDCPSNLGCPSAELCLGDCKRALVELPPLYGPHGSGLLHRLGGAQRMLDAGLPISSWVAAQIDNEAADAIERLELDRDTQRDITDREIAELTELKRANEALRARMQRQRTELRRLNKWLGLIED